ncbi:MAG TPA: hypothetical protein VHB54_12320 [Mucilaginibacter sp.]|nr:hypothetical protein [Mucilaginibacter sp.]
MPPNNNNSADFPLDPKKEGLMETVMIVPVTKDNPRGERTTPNNLREFNMMATIVSIPPLWNNKIVAGQLVGGSTLLKLIDQQLGSYTIETHNGTFSIHLNEYKELAATQATIKAVDFSTAAKDFQTLVNPYLSILSWKYKVPLSLSNINGVDSETQIQSSKFIQPISQKQIKISINEIDFFDDSLAALYSYNREMLNSTSGPYRLLCIYKCFSIIKLLHDNVRKSAQNKNLDLSNFKSVTEVKIDETDLNKQVWPDAIGWKLSRLLDEKIRPLRNKIAHEFDDNGDFTNPDMGIFAEKIRDHSDALTLLMRTQFEKIVYYHTKYIK